MESHTLASNSVELVKKALNKANHNGVFDLTESHRLLTAVNSMSQYVKAHEDGGKVDNKTHDIAKNCLTILHSALNKSSLGGSFDLDEAYLVKVAYNSIVEYVKMQQNTKHDNVKEEPEKETTKVERAASKPVPLTGNGLVPPV